MKSTVRAGIKEARVDRRVVQYEIPGKSERVLRLKELVDVEAAKALLLLQVGRFLRSILC